MKKIKFLIIIVISILILYFPFFYIGGDYYRGIVGIWHKYKFVDTPGFNPIVIPEHTFYEPLLFADPTSFRYIDSEYAVDRFSVYIAGNRIPNSDGKTFRSLGNGCYVDKYNARCSGNLALKTMSKDSEPESFDVETFQGNILTRYKRVGDSLTKVENSKTKPILVKDKTGIFTRWVSTGGGREIIGGLERNFPIYGRIENVDAETFEARLVYTCHWDEKKQTCVYQYDCVLTDKNFIYETGSEDCEMTGRKFPNNLN